MGTSIGEDREKFQRVVIGTQKREVEKAGLRRLGGENDAKMVLRYVSKNKIKPEFLIFLFCQDVNVTPGKVFSIFTHED